MNIFTRAYYWCYRNLNPADWYRSLKWFLQRHIRGHSDQDIWDLCTRLPEIIHAHLTAFKKSPRYGIPSILPEIQVLDIDNNDHNFEVAKMIWEFKLDAMVEAFRILKDDDFDLEEDVPHSSSTEGERKEVEGGCITYTLPEWKEKKNHEWAERNEVKRAQQKEKVKYGMDLFSKYIGSLWD